MDILQYGPTEGDEAYQFCWHDRPDIELQTKDGRVIAKYSRRQLRPVNPEVWATYFVPPIVVPR